MIMLLVGSCWLPQNSKEQAATRQPTRQVNVIPVRHLLLVPFILYNASQLIYNNVMRVEQRRSIAEWQLAPSMHMCPAFSLTSHSCIGYPIGCTILQPSDIISSQNHTLVIHRHLTGSSYARQPRYRDLRARSYTCDLGLTASCGRTVVYVVLSRAIRLSDDIRVKGLRTT